jgi:hypothetical protein
MEHRPSPTTADKHRLVERVGGEAFSIGVGDEELVFKLDALRGVISNMCILQG